MGKRKLRRAYNILFLIDVEKKVAYLEPSFSKEPAAILRMHLRGEKADTIEFFSKENFSGTPSMWVWKAGEVTKDKAMVCLLEWQKVFRGEGYTILGVHIASEKRAKLPKLSGIEKMVLKNIDVADLLDGKIADRVESGGAGEGKYSASQKFVMGAAEDTLRLRVKEDTAHRFRSLCRDLEMTQNQVLELLMSGYTGETDPLIWDLRGRLEKANTGLKKKDQMIRQLRVKLDKCEEDKEYPKAYVTAYLQNELLREFFNSLPIIKMSGVRMLKRYSNKMGREVFPEQYLYSFPKEEGNVKIRLEHMQYSRGVNPCIFLFGKDHFGNKLKIRWYPQKRIRYGESMWDSPYLWYNSPWILAVRKDGDAMELVGSIPDLAKIYCDMEERLYDEVMTYNYERSPQLNGMEDDDNYDPGDSCTQAGNLDDLILTAEKRR